MKSTMRQHKGRMALVCVIAMAMFVMMTGVAFAETSNTSAVLTGGTPTISIPLTAGTFAGTLTGAAADLLGTGFGDGFTIIDPSGTGSGWSVAMRASQFLNDDLRTQTDDIVLDSLTMPLLKITGNTGSSAAPTLLVAATTIDRAADVVVAQVSSYGQGMGTYVFTTEVAEAPWKLAITAGEYAGTYTSTITTTLATLTLIQTTLASFTPGTGAVATSVTLTGTGFTGATNVTFGGTSQSTLTVVSDTQITVTVPAGAVTGPITVTTPTGGTATSATEFIVTL